MVQFVSLLRGGEKVSMSTRSGEFETLSDVVNEVGVDAARYFFLMRGMNTHLNFDINIAKTESDENPVFYLQYAYARIRNIINKSLDLKNEVPDTPNLLLLSTDIEIPFLES